MAKEDSGFGIGLFLGGVLGLIAGAYVASGPGRDTVDTLRTRTVELTGPDSEFRSRARTAASRAKGALDPTHPVGRAVQDGLAAARRRRVELAEEDGGVPPVPA
ncbi:MAG TPA: hypothetical protein VG015_08865 [Candidatus Dormibacteraeota bacterium]|jgi:hypothetical protein|nr:hypothetical protein [Candidatus Dormibacteraeota bacterium]